MKKRFIYFVSILCLLTVGQRSVWAQGSVRALSFDGNDWIRLPLLSSLNGQQQVTFSCWVRYGDPNVNQTLFAHWGNSVNPVGTNVGFYITLLNHRLTANTSAGWWMQTAAEPLVPGNWYHVAVVFDGTLATDAERMRMYVNGEQQLVDFTNQPVPVPTAIGDRAVITQIGARRDNGNVLIDHVRGGVLDEMALWYRALSPTEIRHKMTERLAGNEPGLVAYYRMDEGADGTCPGGQDVCDASGNANHGV
ncbi:MAG: LamG domain-containing protein, partial [Flammeovirgaceae bacterium]|nr:LamG domain-containing protein [Flammeovirgaceae bacterium]